MRLQDVTLHKHALVTQKIIQVWLLLWSSAAQPEGLGFETRPGSVGAPTSSKTWTDVRLTVSLSVGVTVSVNGCLVCESVTCKAVSGERWRILLLIFLFPPHLLPCVSDLQPSEEHVILRLSLFVIVILLQYAPGAMHLSLLYTGLMFYCALYLFK